MRRIGGLLLLLLCCAAPAHAGELRAGVGRADITPPVGTPLGGYAARKGGPSTGVHDPIQAKALVLDDGATRLAIITSDLVGTNPEMVRRVAETAGFPQDHLMVCASHTHSGPGAYGKGLFAQIALGSFQQTVFDHLTQGMVQALKQAVASLQPAKLAIGESELPQFMRNRRKARVKDPALWLLRVDTRDGKPLAALVDLTAHGTVLEDANMELSGDWMGYTQRFLEKEVPGLTALYANGAEGDISPNIPDNSSTFEGAQAHGETGGKAALELYRTLKPAAEVTLASKTAPLELPASLKASLIGAGKTTTLQYFAINDALLMAVPGEMITQLGLALKAHARRQGHAHPVIIGLANDHLGYLLTRAEMKRGGYETTVSFFGDDFGEELTLAMARLVGGEIEPVKEAISAPPAREGRKPEAQREGQER
ncbi:MAG TPA: neutral/alkaline non-lysosomal ceramidase N-terminal domain-containing protein [Armatimonadota bacterium]|nr:neutral/alkaline non-lysosomal ceramidase N-terminal domain-containing protein [Armatimonadota bacterium]